MTTQTTAAPLVVGELVRVRNASSAFHDMTGTVVEAAPFIPSVREIRMTSTGHVLRFNVAELARVPDAAGSK